MKIKFILLSIISLVVFTACQEKDLYEDKPVSEQKVTDLNIPLDFDWKTTRAVTCNFVSATDAPLYIYNDKSCSDESLLAIHTVTAGGDNPLRLHLPLHLETVYVKLGEEVIPVAVKDFNVNCILPEVSAEISKKWSLPTENNSYIPSKGDMVTMMFEDYFPTEGDYDFNDLVINYKYEITYVPYSERLISMKFDMIINALGGVYPFDPCLRLEGIETDYVERIGISNNFTLDRYTDFDEDVCFRMLGLTGRPAGCTFLNTDPNETIVPESDLIAINMVIEFKSEGEFIPKRSDLESVNIFLDREDLEIHEKGYTPAHTQYPDFPEAGNENYCNNKNLVWALTVPVPIKHAKEKIDFLQAYPEFKTWLESGGEEGKDWYLKGKEENLFTIPQ